METRNSDTHPASQIDLVTSALLANHLSAAMIRGSPCVVTFFIVAILRVAPVLRSCSLTGFHPKVSLMDWGRGWSHPPGSLFYPFRSSRVITPYRELSSQIDDLHPQP